MSEMFLILKVTYLNGYADNSTPFKVRNNMADVIKALEEIREDLLNWFANSEISKIPINVVHF